MASWQQLHDGLSWPRDVLKIGMGWIEPSTPSEYLVTRRDADASPGHKTGLPDLLERFEWDGSSWIVGHDHQGRPVRCSLHSDTGWRIQAKIGPTIHRMVEDYQAIQTRMQALRRLAGH